MRSENQASMAGRVRRRIWHLGTIALVFAVALALVAQASPPSASAQTAEPDSAALRTAGTAVPGRFAIKLTNPDDPSAIDALAASGFEVVRELGNLGWVVVERNGPLAGNSLLDSSSTLAASPGVAGVEPVLLYQLSTIAPSPRAVGSSTAGAEASNDPLIWSQWGHYSVNATSAWEITRGSGTVVAVIDSGVDATHPDLAGQVLPGFDFWSNDDDPTDEQSHGTHVAGTIAASRNNSAGGTGIAPEAKILPVRVCGLSGEGCGTDAIANGIEWATDNGADVINLSLGAPVPSQLIADAVAYAIANDVVVVAAAGNDGIEAPNYPAAFPDVIGVGALTPGRENAWFSNRGPHVDVLAPGVEVLSTIPGSYDYFEGTSMASPHVAGIAALLRAEFPGLSSFDIASTLFGSAVDLGPSGYDTSSGWGAVDAYRALTGGDPDGDYFELEVDHTFVGDLRIHVLQVGGPERQLFFPKVSPASVPPFSYVADNNVRLRYALPDQVLQAVPGTWALGVADHIGLETGSIISFRVRSGGIVYSYPGAPLPIPDGTGEFVVAAMIVGNDDAELAALSISSGTMTPSFDPTTFEYSATVPNETASVEVKADLSDPNATLAINGIPVSSGVPEAVPLGVGENAIDVVVTAENGVTEQTYTVTVTRVALATDATLSDLTVSEGVLTPAFDPATTDYAVEVPNAVDTIDVSATTANGGATLSVEGNPAVSGAPVSVALPVGVTEVNIDVLAEDGVATETYTVTVTRAVPPTADDATLASLLLSEGTLTPSFASGVTAYTAAVATGVESIEVTAATNHPAATLQIEGGGATNGVPVSVPLGVGDTAIEVVVTAEDGVTEETYTVTVTRAAPSSDATLSVLSLSAGALSPAFAPATFGYTASVPNAVDEIDVSATPAHAGASRTINGGADTTVALAVGENLIEVAVTAEDGATTETYNVTVTRAAPPAVDDASLAALSLSSGALSPTFDPATLAYSAGVGNSVAAVTVAATPANPAATITVNGDADPTVALSVGANPIEVVVTAEDGIATETYSITVTRAAAPPPPPPGGGGGGGGGGSAVQTIEPHLEVINDDGGSATVDDFTALLDGEEIPFDEPSTGGSGLNRLTLAGPVTLYAVTYSGDCDAGGFFSLAFGDEFECDIVADDLPLTQIASVPVPDAETLIEERLSVSGDAIVVDGLRVLEASTAETPPQFLVRIPTASVAGQPVVTVRVTTGNQDLARFNAPAGTSSVAGTVFDIEVLNTSGDPITTFPVPVTLSFLLPEGADLGRLAPYSFDGTAGSWGAISGRVVGDRFEVETSHLSTFAIFEFAVGGGFAGAIAPAGVTLAAAEGGTLGQLELAMERGRVKSVFIAEGGQLIGYVRGAPTFVNADFIQLTGGVLAPGRPLLVVVDG